MKKTWTTLTNVRSTATTNKFWGTSQKWWWPIYTSTTGWLFSTLISWKYWRYGTSCSANGWGYYCIGWTILTCSNSLGGPIQYNGSPLLHLLTLAPSIEAPVNLSLMQWFQEEVVVDIFWYGMRVFLGGLSFFREVTEIDGSFVSQSWARPDALSFLTVMQQRG